jgi:hypothetical protein
MRKPRDFDSELKALAGKQRVLKARRVQQLGELVVMCGADALDPETLAGVLLGAVENRDKATKEAWRSKGAAFFQGARKGARSGARAKPGGDAAGESDAVSA